MKKTQWKDTIRNIGKRKVSFLSICIIVALGVATYLGITYTGAALENSGSRYHVDHNTADFEMTATLGITDDDVRTVCSVEDVEDAEGVYMTSGQINKGNVHSDVDILSLTDRISRAELLSGRMPETPDECVVEDKILKKMNGKVGDTISLCSSTGVAAEYLRQKDYVITGTVIHPDHITTNIYGNPYVLVQPAAFDTEQTEDGYMKMYVRLTDTLHGNIFKKKYADLVKPVTERLENLSVERAEIRDIEIHDKISKEIQDNEDKLKSAKEQLNAAKKRLEDGKKKLTHAKEKLDEGKKQLTAGKKKLAEGKKKLAEGRKKLADAKKQLAEGKRKLDDAQKKIEENKKKIFNTLTNYLQKWKRSSGSKKKYIKIVIDDAERYNYMSSFEENIKTICKRRKIPAKYEDMILKEWKQNAEFGKYRKKLDAFADAYSLYNEKKAEYLKGEKEYRKNYDEYQKKYKEYQKGLKKYKASKKLYKKKMNQYRRGLKTFRKNKKEYQENWKKYHEGVKRLDTEKHKLKTMKKCVWFQFGIKAKPSYSDLSLNAENISSLALSFALLFVLVGAMVCYATIGRIVEEQRNLLGGMKALGLTNLEIFKKYLFFGIGAALIGIISGILLAYFAFQPLILRGYQGIYVFGKAPKAFVISDTILVSVIGLGLAAAAAYLACSRLLKTPAIHLMNDEMPKKKKQNKKGAARISSKFSLFSRLIFRNMWMDKKRVMTTIIGVAGCTALLVIGFSLKFSVEGVPKIQYGKIVTYDRKVSFNPDKGEDVAEQMSRIFDEADVESMKLYDAFAFYSIGGTDNMVEILAADVDQLQNFYSLLDPKTDEPVPYSNEGVLIQKRMAEVYDLKAGDVIQLYDSTGEKKEAVIAGIFENYSGRTMVMSQEYFEKVFEKECRPNSFFLKTDNCDEAALKDKLAGANGFMSYDSLESTKSFFESTSKILNGVVGLLTFMAAVMALVVLLNLASMYVTQKKTELIIMRINGFTVRETIGYIARETVATTILGLAAGIGVGAFLAYLIIRQLEKPELQLIRDVSVEACALSVGITIIFSAIVNYIALRKVKHFKVTDIL